jgi:hypothetical protein
VLFECRIESQEVLLSHVGHRGSRSSPFLLEDDRDDLIVPTLGRQSQSCGRLTVGIDALARFGAKLHQQPHEIRPPRQHRVMQRLMLVILRDIQIDDLRTSRNHYANRGHVTRADRFDQPADGDAINERFERRPTSEAVRARQHELGVG